jgi:hypothetical protein
MGILDTPAVPTAPGNLLGQERTISPRITGRRARGIVCFTWDDNYATQYTLIRPLANTLGQRHTFCVNSNMLSGGTKMTAAQVTQLYADGHEIASHTPNHTNLSGAAAALRLTEYDKTALETITAVGAINTFSYPNGISGRTVTSDQELYLRYKRYLTTSNGAGKGSGGNTPNYPFFYRMDQPAPIAVGRYPWYTQNVGAHAALLDYIRLAASEPIVLLVYGHDIDDTLGPTTAQMIEGMTLCSTLGVPCMTISEAFPQLPPLRDPSFEDSTLAFWDTTVSGTGTVASVVDSPVTNFFGTRSLKLSCTDTASFCFASQGTPVFLGAGQISWSCRYRVVINSAGSPGAVLRVRWFDQAGTQLSGTSQSAALTSTVWASANINATPTAGAVWALAEFLLQNQNGDFYVDHCQFYPTTEGAVA